MSKKRSTKLKDMLNEHYILGELPSSKLMKMKWNPVTGETMNEEETNEVAPKMKVSPFVKQVGATVQLLGKLENNFKREDGAGYSHTKGQFKKAAKALAELSFAIRKYGKNY